MVYVFLGLTGIIFSFYLIYIRNKKLEFPNYKPFIDFDEKLNCSDFLTSKNYQILGIPSLLIYIIFFAIAIIMSIMRFAHFLFYVFTPLMLISSIIIFRMFKKKSYCLIYILIIFQALVIWLGSLIREII